MYMLTVTIFQNLKKQTQPCNLYCYLKVALKMVKSWKNQAYEKRTKSQCKRLHLCNKMYFTNFHNIK